MSELDPPHSPLGLAKRFGPVATILVAFAGVVAFLTTMNIRIEHLDQELKAVVTTNPSATGSPASGQSNACADLASRVAAAYEKGDRYFVAEPIERLMERMGCAERVTPPAS